MSTASKETKQPRPLPAPNSDFYELAETLPAEELSVVREVRTLMDNKVPPIIKKYRVDDAFPFEIFPAIKDLNIGGVGMEGYGCRGGSALLFGLVAMEMSRTDVSIATFFGVHKVLRWFRSIWPVPKSRNSNRSRQWHAGKKSGVPA